MNRAEFIKKYVEKEKEAGKYHEKIEICDNSKGNSYKKILGRFLDEYVTKVVIEDPYVRNVHQVTRLTYLFAPFLFDQLLCAYRFIIF